MKYAYTLIDSDGKKIKGTLEAATLREAEEYLKERHVVALNPSGWSVVRQYLKRRSSTTRDLARFARELGILLKVGVPLTSALQILAIAYPGWPLKEAERRVVQGESLSLALDFLPDEFCRLLRVAEGGEMLNVLLADTADFYAERENLTRKVWGALFYPLLVLSLSIVSLLVLVFLVLPNFFQVFSGMNITLPPLTRLAMGVGNFLVEYGGWVVVLGVGLLLAMGAAVQTASGKIYRDRWLLRMPYIAAVCRALILARFFQLFSLLLRAGVPLAAAIKSATEGSTNSAFQSEMEIIYRRVKQGKGLAQSLKESPFFPPLVGQMIAVGEASGTLEMMTDEIAKNYAAEGRQQVQQLAMWLEPAAVLIVGIIVGIFALAMLSPIGELARVLQQ